MTGKEISPGKSPEPGIREVLHAINETFRTGTVPADLPPLSDEEIRQELARLLADLAATQQFGQSLARGDLSEELAVKGRTAGCLKALQSNLRHLTWQAGQVKKGDLTQHVDFMGEFSSSFNAMVASLAQEKNERTLREEALKRSRQMLTEAMDLATMADWEYDVRTRTFTFSDRFYALYGTTPEREGSVHMSAERYAREFVHPQDQGFVFEEEEKAVRTADPGYVSQREHRIIRKDGTIRYIVVRFGITKDADGNTVSLHGANQDITDRKKLEEELRESKEWYSAAINNAPGPILILEEGIIEFINTAGILASGYPPEELLGKSIFAFLLPESQEVSRDAAVARAGTAAVSEYEVKFLRKDNEILSVIVRAIDLSYKGKTVTFALLTDITERKKADEALRVANRQLNLLSGITRHDILNKVTGILGYLELARMKPDDPEVREYLEKIDDATKAIRSQIEFTRIYQDLGTHAPQWIDLDMVMPRSQVPATIALDARVRGILIFTDPMIEKVFFNLLENSLRHGERVTAITVSYYMAGDDLVVVWEDNGVGIAADEKEKIFERGFGKNTGLGMFLVREILSLTGLSIKETGVPGTGARFEILVPKGAYRVTAE